jgi:hypothetical protein
VTVQRVSDNPQDVSLTVPRPTAVRFESESPLKRRLLILVHRRSGHELYSEVAAW